MIDPQWVQGALLDPKACKESDLDGLDLGEGDVLIVITQSCDIAHGEERFVEAHVGRSIASADGNYTYRKNPRTLDLETDVAGTARTFRIIQAERRQIPRKRLSKASPVDVLPEDHIRLLARWTADRYVRPALPDAFNERRRSSKARISKIARQNGKDLSGIYVALNAEIELPADEAYEIYVLGTVPHEAAVVADRWQVACDAIEAIVEALRCPGILVLDSETRSEANVSLQDIKQLSRLELDYISERDGGEAPTA